MQIPSNGWVRRGTSVSSPFSRSRAIAVAAAPTQATDVDGLDLLLLGGLPIREPIAHYGPFLMNTRQQLLEAIEDFNAGRLGRIPAAIVDGDARD